MDSETREYLNQYRLAPADDPGVEDCMGYHSLPLQADLWLTYS